MTKTMRPVLAVLIIILIAIVADIYQYRYREHPATVTLAWDCDAPHQKCLTLVVNSRWGMRHVTFFDDGLTGHLSKIVYMNAVGNEFTRTRENSSNAEWANFEFAAAIARDEASRGQVNHDANVVIGGVVATQDGCCSKVDRTDETMTDCLLQNPLNIWHPGWQVESLQLSNSQIKVCRPPSLVTPTPRSEQKGTS